MGDIKAEDLFLEADQLSDDNKNIEARNILLELLSDFPDYGRAHNLLGWLYQNKFSNNTKAKLHYEMAIKYASDFGGGYNNYAYLLVETNKYDEMLSFGLENINNNSVDKAVIYNKLGQAYELKGDLLNALECYNLSIKDTLSLQTLESMYSAKSRVKKKMSFFQKIKTLNK
ncbi:MAG: hypothetical protein V3V28_10620 [Polaribacter sp.]|uniref:hypothetical protein n=1 Tax=Polaribacter sp. TaxID=1920175 RepID=UPI002F357288